MSTSSLSTLVTRQIQRPLKLIEDNLRKPTGWFGRLTGRVMAVQHRSLTDWTIDQMAVEPTHHLLDIGCGGGMAIEVLSKIATDGFVAGVDYSQEMVQQASQRNAKAVEQGRVKVQQGNALDLSYPEGAFDKVSAIETLYFWPDPVKGLREARRVLKPGGQVTVTLEMSKESMRQSSALRKLIVQRYLRRAAAVGQLILSGNDLTEMLGQAGFRNATYLSRPEKALGWVCATAVK